MSEHRRQQQQPRRPRPSRSEREQRCISTQVNQLANRLPQVNQDFLNLARTQLEAFNSLQRESRNSYTSPQEPLPSRSRSPSPPRAAASYRQRPSLLSSGIRTPPTPRRPSSSPEPPREDSETLPDSSRQHSPTPSVIGWDSYIAENRQTRQATDRYLPEYTERTQLPARHPHALERPRQQGGFSSRGSQLYHRGQPRRGGYQHRDEETTPSREDTTSGARGRRRGRGGQRARSLHERIRF